MDDISIDSSTTCQLSFQEQKMCHILHLLFLVLFYPMFCYHISFGLTQLFLTLIFIYTVNVMNNVTKSCYKAPAVQKAFLEVRTCTIYNIRLLHLSLISTFLSHCLNHYLHLSPAIIHSSFLSESFVQLFNRVSLKIISIYH